MEKKKELLEYIYKHIDWYYYFNRHKEIIKVIFIWDILQLLEDYNMVSSRWVIYDTWKFKDLPIEKQSLWLIQQVYMILQMLIKK